MSKDELVQLVRRIVEPDPTATSEELDALVEQFVDSVSHPGGLSLIFNPEDWGLGANPTAEDIVEAALAWKPRTVVMRVTTVRRHPFNSQLWCYIVEQDGIVRTQIVSPIVLKVGDHCVVALSGAHLVDQTYATHGFIDRAFTAGKIIERTDAPVGTEL